MFWLRNKKNNFPLHTLIWRPEIRHKRHGKETQLILGLGCFGNPGMLSVTSSPPNLMQDMHSVQLQNVAIFFIDAKEFFNKVEHI